ncbi:MAG: D-sedoheptulose 7-phosphate isomerase [Actinomycetota bacterium]|nr:D-sedoheptulose 7-phosphate isomerase [Actinomycetota bacterium]
MTAPMPMPGPMPTGVAHVRELTDALTTGARQLAATTDEWGRVLADVMPRGHRLLAVGNGGSAAQAQHLTAELVGRYRDDRAPLSAIALHAETSSLTAIVNDFGADDMFARQVTAHGREHDVLVLMSTSGRSPNMLRAAQAGRRAGLTVWAMTGPTPNPLADVADDVLAVNAASTATVQEVHLVALHLLCAALDVALGVCPATVLDLRSHEVLA